MAENGKKVGIKTQKKLIDGNLNKVTHTKDLFDYNKGLNREYVIKRRPRYIPQLYDQ